MARKPTSYNLDDDVRGYVESEAKAAGISNSEFITGLVMGVKSGTLAPVKPDTENKTEDELKKEKLAIDIEIKKQIRDMNDLARKNAQADYDLKLERIRKLQRENDRAEGAPFPVAVQPAMGTGVPPAIQQELAKDTAQPQPKKTPSRVSELPANQALVGCDTCHAVFVFDNIDAGFDEFCDHIEKLHSRRGVSHNETVQFRYARDRLEKAQKQKGVPTS